MSYLTRQSNGIAPNGRADKSCYQDSSQGNSSFSIYLISSVVSQQQKTHYQGSSDGGPFDVQSISGGSKSSPHNPNVRSQYSNSYHASPNTSPQSNNHAWDRGPPHFNSQHGTNRYNMNSHLANGNLSDQSRQNPNPFPNHQSKRRQTQPPRPQVRLPSAPSSIPNHKNQQSSQLNRDSDLKSRQPPQSTHVKSAPVSSGRHRHSTSNSSKTSTGSTGWSSTVNASSNSSLSSTPSWESKPQPPHIPEHSDAPPHDSTAADSEWLLLRKETFDQPPPRQRDKYAHLHPLVRKYAGITNPEVKMGEPRMANAVMSRRWQREETLERDKREFQRRREEGVPEVTRATCFTEQQDRASRLAMQTLEILRTEFFCDDGTKPEEEEDKREEDIGKTKRNE
jgi:hypothetical protein